MKDKVISESGINNLSLKLYKNHKKDILATRQALIDSFEKKSLSIGRATKNILNKKINKPSNVKLPSSLFELFPWIIKDLANISYRSTYKVSINWLAVCLYVSFLDDYLDSKTEIIPDEFLGASVLGQRGIANLFKIVNGTKLEHLFNESLFSSATYQLTDVLEQAVVNERMFGKAKSASGKNKILIACAGALAATKENKSKFIIELTKKLLLAVQFLDDLSDFEDDFKQNNITILLNDVAKSKVINSENFERNELLSELIAHGSLLNVVKKIESSLSASIVLIRNNLHVGKTNNPSYSFFTNFYLEILTLRTFLEENNDTFHDLPIHKKIKIIGEIDKSIKRIYCHT